MALFWCILIACKSSPEPTPAPTPSSYQTTDHRPTTSSTTDTGSSTFSSTGGLHLDAPLAKLLQAQTIPVTALVAPPPPDPALVALGRALFFDPILSGPKDIACATCHHPVHATSDALPLSIGTGGLDLGPDRAENPHPPYVARHAPELFNRGDEAFTHLFWDSRVQFVSGEALTEEAFSLPPGLNSALAAQALVPLANRQEMAGEPGQLDALGQPCVDVCDAPDAPAMWSALVQRLRDIDAYQPLFEEIGKPSPTDWEIVDVANAIAAFEASAFTATDTPWDRYLAGDRTAITAAQKLGAMLFYGASACSECHSGPLLTDHLPHNTAVVQLGPGRPGTEPLDLGRAEHDDQATPFSFRTPPLRNVELTAPYMHNGSIPLLELVTLHYGYVATSAEDYDPQSLPEDLQGTVQTDPDHLSELVANLDDVVPTDPSALIGLSNLRQFLLALTDESSRDLQHTVPTSVPSGLPVP